MGEPKMTHMGDRALEVARTASDVELAMLMGIIAFGGLAMALLMIYVGRRYQAFPRALLTRIPSLRAGRTYYSSIVNEVKEIFLR